MAELKNAIGTRKLLTILAADVAEYSKHIERNETNALDQLSILRGFMDPLITQHGGKIANTAGDSVLAYFESPVEALRAAISFQEKQKLHNATVAPVSRLSFRIGLNIGDVSIQPNGDILGHGVNLAARLEALAEPGGICVSANVMDQVEGKFTFDFTKVGEHRVKNIDKPITVFSIGANERNFAGNVWLRLKEKLRKPAYQFGFLTVVIALLAFWVFAVLPGRQFSPRQDLDLPALLATNPSPDVLLDFFDLVSEGEFEGSRYYVIRSWGGEWHEMQEIARILGGHIVAINSAEENQFVYELTLKDEGHWIVMDGNHMGPMIGLVQSPDGAEPAGGWSWSNGEPLEYINWKTYGPENSKGNQEFANFGVPGNAAPGPTWNDIDPKQHAFVVEVPL